MRAAWLLIGGLPLVLSITSPAYGDDIKRLDLSVPDIPAFTVLGVSPSTISRPDNVKDLVAALGTGVSSSGAIQSGLALEVSPAQLLSNAGVSALDAPALVDWLGPLRVSAATNGVAASASTQNNTENFVAVALRYGYTTYNPKSDARLIGCLGSALTLAKNESPPPAPPPAVPAPVTMAPASSAAPAVPMVTAPTPTLFTVDALQKNVLQKCKQLARAANLAPLFAIEAAYAHSEIAINSAQLDQLHPDTDTGWLSVTTSYESLRSAYQAAPVCEGTDPNCPQKWSDALNGLSSKTNGAWAFAPIVFGKVDVTRIAPTTSTDRENNIYIAARLPFITDGWSAFFEVGHKFMDVAKKLPAPRPNDTTPAGIGGEVRLSDGTWLGIYASADLQNGAILSLGNIKWSLGQNAPF